MSDVRLPCGCLWDHKLQRAVVVVVSCPLHSDRKPPTEEETKLFMRDMAKMFCGCSFSGYVRCEEHKDVPLPEPTYTKADLEQLREAIAVRVEGLPCKYCLGALVCKACAQKRRDAIEIRSTKI